MKIKTLSALPMILVSCLMLTACGQEERGNNPIPSATTAPAEDISITALSTQPWLVTGGDVLVEITLPAEVNSNALQVEINGQNITTSFRQVNGENRFLGLVTDLLDGDNSLVASITSTNKSRSLALTNYPNSGPIISGPHEQPYYCQTEDFELVTGALLGQALDSNCSVATRVDYVYWSNVEETFKPYSQTFDALQPDDLGELISNDGSSIPFIVRVETGTVNRAIYEIALLHNPVEPSPDPWNRSIGWNGKLVYTHGGGCRGGWYQQGDSTGGVLRKGLLEMGYAITSATLNVFGQNCNDLLASETHIMVKERFIEHYGDPVYTIGTGGSGGSYQSHQTADNYPGVFDGIIVSSSFPDVTSATIFTLADARLLNHYFTATNSEDFTVDQQRAVSGFGSWGSIANLARGAARLDPIYGFDTALEEQGGEVSIEALQSRRYQSSNPGGVRATVYDHTVNVYGLADNGSMAARPLDNVGVQYGLSALNEGLVTPQQFIDLNQGVGGYDRDMNHVPQRHRADEMASKRAIESGRILYGGAGLAVTPVIDYRSYTDSRENGDIHMIVHQYTTRQRMINANGHADNHVMNVGGLWGFTEEQPDLGDLFRAMDVWLIAISEDDSNLEKAAKVVRAKPASLSDNCWDYSGPERTNIKQPLSFESAGRCGEIYRAFPTPRLVAGAPLANNIISCQLKPVDPDDYQVSFTPGQLGQLRRVFPDGVCDWSRPDKHNAAYQGTWLSFGPSPVNQIQ